ncbi:putative glucuronosyltransferase [Carex littledalei]|uniref:Glycosyltransferases n=1 Tax=Carex littledalei TaxID=544730 RepID=A0A833VSQ9_9POAL|nr:putative glucuronosyltransferase [Carex littledalei]
MESPSHRSKNYKLQKWVKPLLHFSVFFTIGFIIAFVPPNTTMSILSNRFSIFYQLLNPICELSDNAGAVLDNHPHFGSTNHGLNGSLIVITTTRSDGKLEPIELTRLAQSLATVPPPLLWIVVEARKKSKITAGTLRGTKLMYRHLTYKENFTTPGREIDHQRNLALRHIELHRLAGIVHFADASVIYDLNFFEEMRKIKRFGVWPVATVGLNRRKVIIEGPICQESNIVGWFSKDASSRANQAITSLQDVRSNARKINVFGIGFDSSILWDPSSSSRTQSTTNTTKEFIKFVLEEATREEETNLKGIPSDCSRVMLWHLHIPRSFVHPFHS